MSQRSHVHLVLAAAGVLLAVPGAAVAFNQFFADDNGPPETAGPGESGDSGDPANEGDGGGREPNEATEPTGEGSDDDEATSSTPPTTATTTTIVTGGSLATCVLEIDHIGADIKSEPDHGSLVLTSVPSGSYSPLATTVEDWAGRDERWFQIDVEGRIGWIVDNPILISSKSTDCP